MHVYSSRCLPLGAVEADRGRRRPRHDTLQREVNAARLRLLVDTKQFRNHVTCLRDSPRNDHSVSQIIMR